MSSNHHHINPVSITRDNYEEYFLLYVDDELTADEKTAVEAFTALHPDLKEELDTLLSTKLPLLDISLEDKQPLFADSMKVSTIDESLLLYIDNELPAAEKIKVEEKISADTAFQLQHQLLLKTKLDATEKVVYPYKEELYHKTEKRIHAYWWRIAVAAVLILWAGSTNWLSDDEVATGPVALQNTQPAQQPITTPGQATDVTPAQEQPAVAPVEIDNNKDAVALTIERKGSNTHTSTALPAAQKKSNPVVDEPIAISEPQLTTTPVNRVDLRPNGFQKASQQIINNAVVTSAVPVRTINTEAHAATPVPVVDAVAITNEKSGSLKGFLRKTTRFIERNTSINPVNADDELLIGAVSINLK